MRGRKLVYVDYNTYNFFYYSILTNHGLSPAVFILKEQGREMVLIASTPEISAYIAPFGPVVP